MNDAYFRNRIERSTLGNIGLQLLESQEKLVSQEYEIENLRIKAAMYKAYFFRNSILAEKLEKQSEENRDALIGGFDGFSYASWRANAVYRTLEDMCDEGLLTEKEYRECKVWIKSFLWMIGGYNMKSPQELFAEALWVEWDVHYGIIHKEKLPDFLRRYNLKLKKGKTLDDIQLAFGRGLKDTFGNTAKQIEKIAEEIDKICIIANWEDAVEKYKIWWNDDLQYSGFVIRRDVLW